MKHRSQGHVQKGLQACVCTSTTAVSPIILTLSAMKISENTEEEPNEGNIHMEYSSV
jgi:hypothetical protein